MKTNLRLVPVDLKSIFCFKCSEEKQFLLHKKRIEKQSNKENREKNSRIKCYECGHIFYYDGEELIMEPCGECEKNALTYLNSLQNPEYLNDCSDRVRCNVCGKLFRLINNELVQAPINYSLYDKNS